MHAGADCGAADSFTGRTPLHELAAAAAAAELLGPSRSAAAGFILNTAAACPHRGGQFTHPGDDNHGDAEPIAGETHPLSLLYSLHRELGTVGTRVQSLHLQHCWLGAGANVAKSTVVTFSDERLEL